MKTYKILYCDDDSAILKYFLCHADSYSGALDQLFIAYPEVYYYEYNYECS